MSRIRIRIKSDAFDHIGTNEKLHSTFDTTLDAPDSTRDNQKKPDALLLMEKTKLGKSMYYESIEIPAYIQGENIPFGSVILLDAPWSENLGFAGFIDSYLIKVYENSIKLLSLSSDLLSSAVEFEMACNEIEGEMEIEVDFIHFDQHYAEVVDVYRKLFVQENVPGIYWEDQIDIVESRHILLEERVKKVRQHLEALKESCLQQLLLGIAHFVTGYIDDSRKSFVGALKCYELHPNSYLRIYINHFVSSLLTQNPRTNFTTIPNVMILYSPRRFTSLDMTQTGLVLSTISQIVPNINVVNTQVIRSKSETWKLIDSEIECLSHLIVLGHGNVDSGFALWVDDQSNESEFFNKTDLDHLFYKNQRLIFMDYNCSDQHFSGSYSAECWNVVHPINDPYNHFRTEAYALGYWRSFVLNGDHEEGHKLGMYCVSLISKDFNSLALHGACRNPQVYGNRKTQTA